MSNEPSTCEHCNGFGRIYNNGDETSGQWVECDVCQDERAAI